MEEGRGRRREEGRERWLGLESGSAVWLAGSIRGLDVHGAEGIISHSLVGMGGYKVGRVWLGKWTEGGLL